jgi:hypothetical protein
LGTKNLLSKAHNSDKKQQQKPQNLLSMPLTLPKVFQPTQVLTLGLIICFFIPNVGLIEINRELNATITISKNEMHGNVNIKQKQR